MNDILPHWLDKQASLNPLKTAIEFSGGKRLSFSDLQKECRAYAKRLASAGVKKGDHIALLSANTPEFVIALHALSYLQAVAVLLNTRLNERELAYQLADAEVSLLLADQLLLTKGIKATELSSSNPSIYLFSELPEDNCADVCFVSEVDLEDLATIIYTSGTTGFPKGVCHTYGNHWWSAISSALNLGLSSEDKWLATLPFFHVGGLSILMKSLIYGMPVHVMEKFDSSRVRERILEDGITLISLVSVLLDKMLEKMKNDTLPEAFRGVLLGGGPAPEILLKKAATKNVAVFQSYGMTETSSQIATLSPDQAIRKSGSAGKPLFPAQLKIISDEKGQENGGDGEIWVKGPMVSSGYYKNDAANQSAFQNGWLATGDAGYLDEEGFLYVLDRRKDLIISGGENIYPAEIEAILAAIPGVREAGVIGKKDEKWGQVPVAFLAADIELESEFIQQICKKHLASYKVPAEVFFVDELPRNASSKLVRNTLVQWLEDNRSQR